ncbi:MAG: hypothetical protein KF841_14505 [Phycisphaerae bacterium]|nr:hypothetical protein [Phycisphaerae bacterium]
MSDRGDITPDFDDDDDAVNYPFSEDAESLPEMMCPSCRATVTEDTQKCPACGDWITPVDRRSGSPRRWIFIAAVVMMLVAMMMMVLR